MTVPLRTAPRVFLFLVLSNLVVTSAELPNVPKPETKAAFDQILQANMEIEPDHFSSPPLPDDVFEGDIILTADQLFNIDIYGDVRGNVSQASGSDSRIRWPNGIIPYEIDCSLKNMPDALSAIQTAMKEWESKTCIRFVKKTSQKDYLWFFRQKGCWCNVGRIGGKTSLSVGHGCEFTHVMLHEIGHAVGFWHEQSRPDRDRYVQVMKQNILPGFDTAFAKYKRDKIDSLGLQYDYGSIMHYPFHAFSKNGQPTLRALRPLNGKKPYQALSNLDAEQTNRMYECSKRRTRRQIAYCRDYSYYCRSWARNGECLRNPNYMRQYCRKSCGMCGTSACVDGSYLCPSWARSGYCGANPGYMRVNCKKSCGLCPRPPTVRPRPPTVRPKPPTVRPKPPTARPKPPTVKPKPPTVKPKPPTTKPLPPGVSCGVRHYGNSAGRIVNGKTAVKNSWPWQAQLKLNGAHKCGGSLVASRWVLTAAHCLKGTSYNPGYRVTLGEHNLRVPEDSEQFFSVKKIIVHPSYQRSTNDYDVALLELDRPAALNKTVSLICLPKQGQSVSVGTYCSITGWGRTGYNRPGAAVLQEASLPIAQQHTCRYNMRYWGQVTSKMLCGGFGGSSTVSGCFGDSGGPFVCKQSGGKYILHGVVSWGTRSCSAGRNEYTVFARVSEFEYWIRKYIGQGVKPPKTPPPPNTPPPPQTPPPPNTPPPPQTPPPPNTPPPSQTPPPPNTPPPPQTPSSKTSVPQTPVTSKPGCVEPKALGMEDFTISNSQITASRSWNELHGPHQARLNLPVGKGGIGAWCPGRQNTEEYLQVDFLEKTVVTHVATQGRESPYPKYVKQYMLSSSDDGTVWALHPEVFEGNNDMSTVKKNQLANPVVARYIRIHPTAWEVDICLRADFYGCPVKPPKPTTSPDLTTTQARTTSQPITTEKPSTHPKPSTPPKPVTDKPPVTSRPRPPIIVPEEPTGMKCEDRHPSCPQFAQAGQCSTNPSWMKENCKKSCGSKRCDKQPVRPTAPCSSPLGVGWDFKLPDSAFSASSTLDVGGGWDSSARNARMYFEDEVKSKRIGAWCAANPENQWLQVDLGTNKYITAVGTQGRHKYYEHVKSYKLATSVDGFSWNFVKQVSGEEKVFPGSCDHFTPVINRLPRGVTARYIRFYPVTYNYVCMRVEVYGCRA